MKISLTPILILLASVSAHAEMRLNLFTLRNPLPNDGRLECRVKDSPQYGYLMERDGKTRNVKVYVINQNKNEGEATAVVGEIIGNPVAHLYIKSSRRYQNIVSYIEFHVSPDLDGATLGHDGVIAFTTGIISKDADGKETEELIPESGIRLVCKVK